ncbi:hypothetical protein EBS67_18980, partial [bacterium]|nr:hypothetical protein [bacterium]
MINVFKRFFNFSQNRKVRRAFGSPRLELLSLEQRINPVTITVDTISDAVGHTGISLRDAIITANSTLADDIIDFSV